MKTKTQDCNGHAIVASGSYRAEKPVAQIEWKLKHTPKGFAFSATGTMTHCGGQCLESIAEAHPNDKTIQEIVSVWRLYHLNDMKAGTVEQMAFLDAEQARNPEAAKGDWYTWAVATLKAAGLYRVQLPRKEGRISSEWYNFGSAWLTHPIPAEVVKQIKGWVALDNTSGLSGYDRQAQTFLESNDISMRITLSDTKRADWAKDGERSGHHYRVTLSRTSDRLVFDFWGSIKDAEDKQDPSAYDVLACLSSDSYCPETFKDFCGDMGESTDSIRALQTFRRCASFAKRIREFFTEDELNQLREIQ